jgi:UvrD/REP helicase N-terminal domain
MMTGNAPVDASGVATLLHYRLVDLAASVPSVRTVEYTATQRAAIGTLDDPLLIVACAGSGKTQVISRRIVETLRRDDGYIGVVPVGGWWKENNRRDRIDLPVRYALLVSLHTDAIGTDIYTPVATQIGIPIEITT